MDDLEKITNLKQFQKAWREKVGGKMRFYDTRHFMTEGTKNSLLRVKQDSKDAAKTDADGFIEVNNKPKKGKVFPDHSGGYSLSNVYQSFCEKPSRWLTEVTLSDPRADLTAKLHTAGADAEMTARIFAKQMECFALHHGLCGVASADTADLTPSEKVQKALEARVRLSSEKEIEEGKGFEDAKEDATPSPEQKEEENKFKPEDRVENQIPEYISISADPVANQTPHVFVAAMKGAPKGSFPWNESPIKEMQNTITGFAAHPGYFQLPLN